MGEDRKMGTHLCGIYLEQMRGLDRHEMGSTSLKSVSFVAAGPWSTFVAVECMGRHTFDRSRNRKHLVTANQFTERMLTN